MSDNTIDGNLIVTGDIILTDAGGDGSGVHAISGGVSTTADHSVKAAVYAESESFFGVYSDCTQNSAIVARTIGGTGLDARSTDGFGIYAESAHNDGVVVRSAVGTGLDVRSTLGGFGIYAQSDTNAGIYTTSGSGPALIASGPILVQGNSVGQATLMAGAIAVTVNTSAATPASNIMLTPLGDPGGQLWVERAASSFTIHTSAAPANDVSVAYLIIN